MDIHLDWSALGVLVVMFLQLIGFVIWLTRLHSKLDYLQAGNEEMKKIIIGLEHVYAKKEDLTLANYKIEGMGKRLDSLKTVQ